MAIDSFLLLACIGLIVAVPPLYYAVFSGGRDWYPKLAAIAAFLALDLIMFGAFTRLTDSGLGCPDWPGCYGHSNPLAAMGPIHVAETALPSGPVTQFKAWVEMIHRYFAMSLGVLIITLTIESWRRHFSGRAASARLSTGILLVVCVQGAFGAYTVTMKLQPIIVTLHLLGGITLLGLLTWQALSPRVTFHSPVQHVRSHAVLALSALIIQIALGGWVSSNYAVLACPDFPLCHGHWLPNMEFSHAFSLWRPLGLTGEGKLIPFESLVAIHWTHRLGAGLVTLLLGSLVWRCHRSTELRGWAKVFAVLLLMQLLTGLANIIWQWPLPMAVLHNGGAALLVMALVWLVRKLPVPT